MPKIVDHDVVRSEIAEAAGRVITRVGPKNASVRMIAAEAGYSPGAPLHYFGSREQLIHFAFKYFAEKAIDELEQTIADAKSTAAALVAAIEVLLDRSAGDLYFAKLLMSLSAGGTEDTSIKAIDQAIYYQARECLTALFAAAHRDGVLSPDADIDAEVDLLITVADGIVMTAMTLGDGALQVRARLGTMLMQRYNLPTALKERAAASQLKP
jgi:AcrR family transcriptional regulator